MGSSNGLRLKNVQSAAPETIASAVLEVETSGPGFTEITHDVAGFLREVGAGDGVLLAYIRHTSASLTIQENADPTCRPISSRRSIVLRPRMPDGCTMPKVRTTCRRM